MAHLGGDTANLSYNWWQLRRIAWYKGLASQDDAQEIQIRCAGYNSASTHRCRSVLLALK
jgi:hypothetical protein